jgi:hypothetical protein
MSKLPLTILLAGRSGKNDSTGFSNSIDNIRTPSPSNLIVESSQITLDDSLLKSAPRKHQRACTPNPTSGIKIKRSTLNRNYLTNTPMVNFHVCKAKEYKPMTFKEETPIHTYLGSKSSKKIRNKRSRTNSPLMRQGSTATEGKTIQDFKLRGCKAEIALPPIRVGSPEKRTRKFVLSARAESNKIELIPSVSQEAASPIPDDTPPLQCFRLKTRFKTFKLKKQNLSLESTPPSFRYSSLQARITSPQAKLEERDGKIRHHIRLLSNRDIYLESPESM